ncbi:MAG: InlB B-repeat-containing protein, partial [Fibrobacter sp.]|nr:InlB B-repeat-containing protein [Fibrobacter sp.]
MKKNFAKVLIVALATVCSAGATQFTSGKKYSDAELRDSVIQYSPNSPLKTSNGHAFTINKYNQIFLTDNYLTSRELDRKYMISFFGVNKTTSFFKANSPKKEWTYAAAYTSDTTANDSNFIDDYLAYSDNSKGGEVRFGEYALNQTIEKAKNLGYYKLRIVADTLLYSEPGEKAWKNMEPDVSTSSIFRNADHGSRAMYWLDYRIPGTATFNSGTRYYKGGNRSLTGSIAPLYYGRDTISIRMWLTGADSLRYRVECIKNSFDSTGTMQTQEFNLPEFIEPGFSIPKYGTGLWHFRKDSYVFAGDSSIACRARVRTPLYDSLGIKTVWDTTYSDYFNIYVIYTMTVSTNKSDTLLGYITDNTSLEHFASRSIFVDAGKNAKFTAHPKFGYMVLGWYDDNGKKITSDSVLNVKLVRDSSLHPTFWQITPEAAIENSKGKSFNDVLVGSDSVVLNFRFSLPYHAYTTIRYGTSSSNLTLLDSGYSRTDAIDATENLAVITKDGVLKSLKNAGKNVKLDMTKKHYIEFCAYSYQTVTKGSKIHTNACKMDSVYFSYPVTFARADGSLAMNVYVRYNDSVTIPSGSHLRIPTDTEYAVHDYHWVNKADSNDVLASAAKSIVVTDSLRYNLVVDSKYLVKFVDYDGFVLQSGFVAQGKAATAPATPNHDGNTTDYKFREWSDTYSNIQTTKRISASYDNRVTFKDRDGKVISSQWVTKFKAATAPTAPAVTGYTFSGWDKKFDSVTDSMTVNATYVINHYNVTFLDFDDSKIGNVQSVAYGSAAVAPDDPEREGYKFTGWDKDFNKIVADLNVKAQYEEIESSSSTAKSSASVAKSSSSTAKSSASVAKSSSSTAKSSASVAKSSSSTAKSSASKDKSSSSTGKSSSSGKDA